MRSKYFIYTIIFVLFILFSSFVSAWKPLTSIYLAKMVNNDYVFFSGVLAPDILVTVPTANNQTFLYKNGSFDKNLALHDKKIIKVLDELSKTYSSKEFNSDNEQRFISGYKFRLEIDQKEFKYCDSKAEDLNKKFGYLYNNDSNISRQIIGLTIDRWVYLNDKNILNDYSNAALGVNNLFYNSLTKSLGINANFNLFEDNSFFYATIHKLGLYKLYFNTKFDLKLSNTEWEQILDYSTNLISEDFDKIISPDVKEFKKQDTIMYLNEETDAGYIDLFFITCKKFILVVCILLVFFIFVLFWLLKYKSKFQSHIQKFFSLDFATKCILVFILYMHFEGFLKLIFNYHTFVYGFRYIFAVFFGLMWLSGIRKDKINPLTWAIGIYTLAVLIQFFNPLMTVNKGWLMSGLGLLWQIGFLPLFFISQRVFNSLSKIELLFKFIIGLTSLSAIFAHIQFIIGTKNYLKLFLWLDNERVVSLNASLAHGPIAFDIKPPCSWYLVSCILCLYFIFKNKQKNKIVYLLLFANIFVALFLSGVRTGLITGIFTILLFLSLNTKFSLNKQFIKRIGIVSFIILISSIFLFSFMSEWNKSRYLNIINPFEGYLEERGFTWQFIKNDITYFSFGVGLRSELRVDPVKFGVEPSPLWEGDNYFLAITTELGVFGFMALLFLYAHIFIIFAKNYFFNKKNKLKNIYSCIFCLLLFFMVITISASFMFWLFLGIFINLSYNQVRDK